jgi:hypothetical protein
MSEVLSRVLKHLERLEAAVATLQTAELQAFARYSENDVSNPPTLEQIEGALGAASEGGTGAIGVINDAGGGANVWLCVSIGDGWWYEALTEAS